MRLVIRVIKRKGINHSISVYLLFRTTLIVYTSEIDLRKKNMG